MMFGLNWITIAIIAGLGILVGVQEMRVQSLKTEHAEYVVQAEKNARMAADQALAEQTRRQQAYDDEAQHARNEIKQLEASVSALADTSDGLRDAVAKYQRTHPTTCVANRSKSKPDSAPGELLAGLYLGLVKASQATSGYAERVYNAGNACERAADSAR